MFPVSSEFKETVRGSHTVTIRAEVWRSGIFQRSLDVIDGQVTVDARRSQRRTCQISVPATKPTVTLLPEFRIYQSLVGSLEFPTYADLAAEFSSYAALRSITGYTEVTVDDGLIPTSAFSDVAPFGNEIRLWRGIEVEKPTYRTYGSIRSITDYATLDADFDTYGSLMLSSGTEIANEEVPLGVFVITEVNVSEGAAGAVMEVVGVDRSIRIAKSLWLDPYPISASTNLTDAISLLLSDRWDDVETDFQTTTQTVPAVTLGLQSGSGDPWQDALKLAEAGGFDLYFDGSGVAVLSPTPDPSTQSPVAVYEENTEAMVLDVARRISTDQTFNGIVVSGEGTNVSPLVRVVAFDEDPSSPTYRYGPFGDRPTFLSSPLVTTEEEGVRVATAQLAKLKGAEENVEWTQITDPSLDAGDIIQIRNTGTRLDKIVVLDQVSIPLAPSGTMKAVARTVRVLAA